MVFEPWKPRVRKAICIALAEMGYDPSLILEEGLNENGCFMVNPATMEVLGTVSAQWHEWTPAEKDVLNRYVAGNYGAK